MLQPRVQHAEVGKTWSTIDHLDQRHLVTLAVHRRGGGIPFPVQLENNHVVNKSQAWCGVLEAGIDKTPLNSSYSTRSDPKYLNSLGLTVIYMMKLVPTGVLVFFPSYSLSTRRGSSGSRTASGAGSTRSNASSSSLRGRRRWAL